MDGGGDSGGQTVFLSPLLSIRVRFRLLLAVVFVQYKPCIRCIQMRTVPLASVCACSPCELKKGTSPACSSKSPLSLRRTGHSGTMYLNNQRHLASCHARKGSNKRTWVKSITYMYVCMHAVLYFHGSVHTALLPALSDKPCFRSLACEKATSGAQPPTS